MTSATSRRRPSRGALLLGMGVVLAMSAVVVGSFFSATTFIGDDHVFLAFARLAPNPFAVFVTDQHGGEFYRPLPMLVWWTLGRLSASSGAPAAWPFAALALALHTAVAVLLASLLRVLGSSFQRAAVVGWLFWIAPQNLEAAYWYAASTDLWATAFVLAALLALVRGRSLASLALALAAYLSKESALVLPLLGYVVLGAVAGGPSPARRARSLAPHAALAVAVVLVRRHVLGGWGGSGDPAASASARVLQLLSGLVHVGTGVAVLPEPLAWGLGVAALALLVLAATRARPTRAPGRTWTPLAFTLVALAPLPAAGWVVGGRYFYLPAVGLAWAAGEALAAATPPARVLVGLALFGLGATQAAARRSEIASYEARADAARRGVLEGARHGARVFHVAGGIKDVDLVVKEDTALAPFASDLLVLGDVPASFVALPPALAERAAFLLAAPPLPPSGAYRFGAARIVGLARRGDDPTLDEVVARFPDIRFIRLRATPGGHVVARDVTEELKSASQEP